MFSGFSGKPFKWRKAKHDRDGTNNNNNNDDNGAFIVQRGDMLSFRCDSCFLVGTKIPRRAESAGLPSHDLGLGRGVAHLLLRRDDSAGRLSGRKLHMTLGTEFNKPFEHLRIN